MGLSLYGVVPDPTLLLNKEDYEKLIIHCGEKNYAYVYMLHSKEKDAHKIVEHLKKIGKNILFADTESIEQWLTNIYYSDVVITNSFHGIVFSIIFERLFVAVLIEGSGMNDRILTLLGKLGLENRIYSGSNDIINKPINWNCVKERLDNFRQIGYDYTEKILNCKKEL